MQTVVGRGIHVGQTSMAHKFGGSRWVKEGYLDNRIPGVVVGHVIFAAVGRIEFYLKGDFQSDIAGQIFSFCNPQFSDDPNAASHVMDLENPQLGTVSSISFDPHPLLAPHPYIEWFSFKGEHYRIELKDGDARLLDPVEASLYEADSRRMREAYAGRIIHPSPEPDASDQEWF